MRSSMRMTGWLRLAEMFACMLVLSLTPLAAQAAAPKTFPTPEEAVVALVDAAQANNTDELLAILGPDGKKVLSSGDPVDDKNAREVFLVAYEEAASLEPDGEGKETLYIGHEDWPFPIPLVKAGGGWQFDTEAGVEEVLFRRIGSNEFSTIRACAAYVAAQKEYARKGRDGKPAGRFAQKFVSAPGQHNGLYWKVDEGEELSPLGELVAEATDEGYALPEGKRTPFHGYFFRILTAQGKDAKGGAKSYITNGEMRSGFALVAFPADYGSSGVMTFIVNQDVVIYEKDLGSETAKIAGEMKEYDPDKTWTRSE